ncbi:MAG: hypothetical protein MUE81_18240 [Thermoflexibacter sp.]|jgi:predicted GH43/DUF377 family glycosyl hydrolase|nr:hypothetical protein [Thermoflexibacter sp.]
METLKNDVFFQNFIEELGDKQVLLINKNKKNVVIRFDLWEYVSREKNAQTEHISPVSVSMTPHFEEMRLAS